MIALYITSWIALPVDYFFLSVISLLMSFATSHKSLTVLLDLWGFCPIIIF